MPQLSLNLIPRLCYASGNFVLHTGVASLYHYCLTLFSSDKFRIGYLFGEPRSGKTHFSIALSDKLLEVGFYPKLLEGLEFLSWLSELEEGSCSSKDIILVDNAQEYFSTLASLGSGSFVHGIEMLRKNGTGVFFISCMPLSGLSLDDHVLSRLAPGDGLIIGPPSIEDLGTLIYAMARQRGIHLSPRKISYLGKRLPCDIGRLELYLESLQYLSYNLGQPIKFGNLGDTLCQKEESL